MKKFLFLLLLIPTFLIGQIQDTVITVKEIEVSETERLVDKYGGAIVSSFNKLVTSATLMAEEGFKMAVKLQIAEGICSLLPFIFFILFSYLFYKEYFRMYNILKDPEENKNKYKMYNFQYSVMHEDNVSFLLIITMLFAILFFILSIIFTSGGVMRLIAPEWYAIKEIIQLLNPQ